MKTVGSVTAVTLGLLLVPAAAASAAPLHTPHQGTTVQCQGEVLWHFVHNQVSSGTTAQGTLTARFDSGQVQVAANKQLKSVRHYDVHTDGTATLLDAADDIAGGKLVLSHTTCSDVPVEECEPGSVTELTWPVELGRPRTTNTLVRSAGTATSLLPGTYDVTLTSTDPGHRAGYQTDQTKEQWYVSLLSGGVEVGVTGTIEDLPTASTTITRSVGTVTLAGTVDTAVATHTLAALPGGEWGGAHSVEPTSAVFVCR